MHEHLFVRMPHVAAMAPRGASRRRAFEAGIEMAGLGARRYGRAVTRETCTLSDADMAAAEIALFARAGGRSVVDVTSVGIGRDPRALAQVSRATGVNVVMGASWYVEANWPPEARIPERSEEDIRCEIVRDLAEASATPASARGSSARAAAPGR
jgi:phosphotriesterase-related protein